MGDMCREEKADLGKSASRHAHEPLTRMTTVHPVAPQSLEKRRWYFLRRSSRAADGTRKRSRTSRTKTRPPSATSGQEKDGRGNRAPTAPFNQARESLLYLNGAGRPAEPRSSAVFHHNTRGHCHESLTGSGKDWCAASSEQPLETVPSICS